MATQASGFVREIALRERRVACQGKYCPHYAEYGIQSRSKEIKLCGYCTAMLVQELCDYGFVRRVANKVIQEKGI